MIVKEEENDDYNIDENGHISNKLCDVIEIEEKNFNYSFIF